VAGRKDCPAILAGRLRHHHACSIEPKTGPRWAVYFFDTVVDSLDSAEGQSLAAANRECYARPLDRVLGRNGRLQLAKFKTVT
jgi:hypothetical protein